MDTHLRALLIEVAEGRMDPEAAARLLDEPAVGATEPAPAGPAGQAVSEPSTPNPTAGPVVPVARVVISTIQYIRDRDWQFATLTIIVLLELAASAVAALVFNRRA